MTPTPPPPTPRPGPSRPLRERLAERIEPPATRRRATIRRRALGLAVGRGGPMTAPTHTPTPETAARSARIRAALDRRVRSNTLRAALGPEAAGLLRVYVEARDAWAVADGTERAVLRGIARSAAVELADHLAAELADHPATSTEEARR